MNNKKKKKIRHEAGKKMEGRAVGEVAGKGMINIDCIHIWDFQTIKNKIKT